jgi:hypothetical protein
MRLAPGGLHAGETQFQTSLSKTQSMQRRNAIFGLDRPGVDTLVTPASKTVCHINKMSDAARRVLWA